MKVMKMKCKSMKYSVISLIFVSVLSAAALITALYSKKSGGEAYSYFFGAATGTFAVALAQALRCLKMRKDLKYRKKQEIVQKDERIINLRNRSMAVSYYITVIALAVASIASAVCGDMARAGEFSSILSLSVAVYFISYLVLSHKE